MGRYADTRIVKGVHTLWDLENRLTGSEERSCGLATGRRGNPGRCATAFSCLRTLNGGQRDRIGSCLAERGAMVARRGEF
jgi:hypothetical protein